MRRQYLVVFVLAVLAGFGTTLVMVDALQGRESTTSRPNIVLITLETTRADRLPCTGYQRDTMPYLCAFAEANATLYERAYTTAPYTFFALPSISSGRYPFEIGLQYPEADIRDEYTLLAEQLQSAGYETYNYPANWELATNGHLRGYRHLIGPERIPHDQYQYAHGAVRHPLPIGDILEREEQPVLIRDHLMTPHDPYYPHITYREEHNYSYIEEIRPGIIQRIRNRTGNPVYWDRVNKSMAGEDLTYLRAAYDETLKSTDHVFIRAYLDQIRASGEWDNTMIIIAGDIGEMLGEHGLYLHHAAYEEVAHIPLIIKYPGQEQPDRSDRLTSLIDIYPTVLAAADVSYDPDAITGKHIRSLDRHEHLFFWDGGGVKAVINETHKYVECDVERFYCTDARILVTYDEQGARLIDRDPPEVALQDELRQYLSWNTVRVTQTGEKISEERKNKLNDLLYNTKWN